MMFTLIAVAMGGYVMIESAPDFSNYAVLTRTQQFHRNLAHLRQAVSSRRFYLSTADGIDFGGGGNTPDQVLVPEEIKKVVENLVPSQDPATTDSSGLSLGTTPVDPFIPSREWGETFWSASYNFLPNPSFYDPARLESRDFGSVRIFFLVQQAAGDSNTTLYITDRTGALPLSIASPNPGAVVDTNAFRHITRAPGDSRLLGQTTLQSVTANRFDVVTFDLSGANRTFATDVRTDSFTGPGPSAFPNNVTTHSAELPAWSPDAGRIAFRKNRRLHTPPPDEDYRLIIKSPELRGAAWDPVGINKAIPFGVKFSNFQRMGPPTWSPNGRFVAFWAETSALDCQLLIYDWERRLWHLPRQEGNGGVAGMGAETPDCRNDGTPLAWGPDSDRIAYVGRGGTNPVLMATNIKAGATAVNQAVATGLSDGTNVVQLRWAPDTLTPEGANNEVLLLLVDTGGNAGEVRRRRLTDPADEWLVVAENAWTGPSSPDSDHALFDISPGGTELVYLEGVAEPRKVMMVGVDSFNPRVVVDLDDVGGLPGASFAIEAGFLTPEPDWIYSPAGIKRLTQANLASFDHEGWRRFTTKEGLFPGDSRFGDGYLSLAPPINEQQFLFDNGSDIFRIELGNPIETVRDGTGALEAPVIGKMTPTWGWRGANYIARESGDVTGGLTADIFKQVVGNPGSGTTVLVTTGTDPAYGPDNELLAVSKAMMDVPTFPPDTSAFPPTDLDIWVVESTGGPVPPPVNLTAGTTDSAERAPAWSPDGKYVFFQREFQRTSRFIGNHSAGIYRSTRFGGSITQIAGEASIPAAWNDAKYVSAMEFYEPAVSPDGTRVAFIGRERLLGLGSVDDTIDTTRVGEIVGEGVYVKDLLFNTPPVCLLRSWDSLIGTDGDVSGQPYHPLRLDGSTTSSSPNNHTGASAYADHGFSRPSWSADGQLIYVNRTFPRNNWYPKKGQHRPGQVGPTALRGVSYQQIVERSQIIRIKATHPWDPTSGLAGIQALSDNSFDPTADNYDVVVQNLPDDGTYQAKPGAPGPVFNWTPYSSVDTDEERQIMNARISAGAYAFQRVRKDVPAAQLAGIGLETDYVLSGYVRSRGGLGDQHSGQIMCFLLNNQGLMIDLTTPGANVFQVGLADVGGEDWTRFSAGIRFPGTGIKNGIGTWGDNPPYTLLLSLYSLGGVGANVEFSGLKLEKAFDSNSKAPTVFYPGWVLHSSSQRPDPSRPTSKIFER